MGPTGTWDEQVTCTEGATVNEEWHAAHVLGQGASLDRRVEWHVEHATACGCREIPATVVAELERRGVAVPERRRPDAAG